MAASLIYISLWFEGWALFFHGGGAVAQILRTKVVPLLEHMINSFFKQIPA